ncbi:MAG: hypothetical protein AAGJ81_13630 [Verrucomicrobiota bacterium]
MEVGSAPYLLGKRTGRIRSLPGFLKGRHHEPDGFFPAASEFVRKIGEEFLEKEASELYRSFRDGFELRRKELEFTREVGTATIQTSDFSVHFALGQDSEDCRHYFLETRVSSKGPANALDDDTLLVIFSGRVSEFVFPFIDRPNLEATIDLVEEIPQLREALDYLPDASQITIERDGIRLCIDEEKASFSRTGSVSLKDLVAGGLEIWASINVQPEAADENPTEILDGSR